MSNSLRAASKKAFPSIALRTALKPSESTPKTRKHTDFEGQNRPKLAQYRVFGAILLTFLYLAPHRPKRPQNRHRITQNDLKISTASEEHRPEMPTRAILGLLPGPQKMLLSIALRAANNKQKTYVCIKYPPNSTLYSYRKRRQALSIAHRLNSVGYINT